MKVSLGIFLIISVVAITDINIITAKEKGYFDMHEKGWHWYQAEPEVGLEQRLIITYSVKYQEYQKNIRNNQINRAMKIIHVKSTSSDHEKKISKEIRRSKGDGRHASK